MKRPRQDQSERSAPDVVVRQFFHQGPYTTSWPDVPKYLRDELESRDISPSQIDGEFLAIMSLKKEERNAAPRRALDLRTPWQIFRNLYLLDEVTGNDHLVPSPWFWEVHEGALARTPEEKHPQNTIWLAMSLWELVLRAGKQRRTATYNDADRYFAEEDRRKWEARLKEPPLTEKAIAHWRHWKPGKIKSAIPETQREIEKNLRIRWGERILSHVLPHAAHLQAMKHLTGDVKAEAMDLLGQSRFRSLRVHCLRYEKMKRMGFRAMPWGENDVRNLLNRFREMEATPYQVASHWATLQWFDKHFGILDVNSIPALRRKKGAVEEDLVKTVTKPQRKSVVPDRRVIWALEGQYQGTPGGKNDPDDDPRDPRLPLDDFILGVARFQVGASARWNDLQHLYPKEMDGDGKTIELKAWQTKTLSQVQGKRHPTPLICPKMSFTGRMWYYGFMSLVEKLTKTPGFENMDYLVPAINKEGTGFIPRPSNADRALRWLKEALHRKGVRPDLIEPLSWHSFRVMIPDAAFQLGISRDQRQYLGNWLTESTADVYTRQKRDVVVRIWDAVMDGARSLAYGRRREVPEDLNHEYWQDPKPTAKESPSKEDPIEDWAVEVHSQEHEEVEVSPIDMADLPGEDELRVMVSARPCAKGFMGRVHLMNMEGKAVGCGWNPRPAQVHELSYEHYMRDKANYILCYRCFSKETFPREWKAIHKPVVDDGQATDTQSDSDSNISADTESENEAIPFNKLGYPGD